MTTLLSLPNELIIHIYTHAPTLQAAACLSAVNKRLRSVWLENTNLIAEAILKRQIPAYDDAVDVAILGADIYNSPKSPSKNDYPLHLYVDRLLRNADLAASATNAWAADRGTLSAEDLATLHPYDLSDASQHASYYLLRKIVVAYQHPVAQLRREMLTTLRATSKDQVLTYTKLLNSMMGFFGSDPESRQSGIFKGEEEEEEEEEEGDENQTSGAELVGSHAQEEEWRNVRSVLYAAVRDKNADGTRRLDKKLFEGMHDLHEALFSTLQASSQETLNLNNDFAGFLLWSSNAEDERLRHGISKDRAEWTESDEMEDEMHGGAINVTHWEYAGDVVDVADRERIHGRHTLKEFIVNGIPLELN
jgi:hypothetical protein